MNRGKPFRRRSYQPPAKVSRSVLVPECCSEIVKHFYLYANEMEDKQDRHERILKIGRDITIESKRLIFYLHTYNKEGENAVSILEEAKIRFAKLVKSLFLPIINELEDLDVYQYQKAYTSGVQEFVEALSFYHYLKYGELLSFESLKKFVHDSLSSEEEFEESEKIGRVLEIRSMGITKPSQSTEIKDSYNFLTTVDHVLGLSDLTGELMRYCINQIGTGQTQTAFDVTRFLTNLYTAMLSVECHIRDYNRKMYTTLANVRKVEMACYTVKVRGSEMPKDMIISVLDQEDLTEDMKSESYYH